MRRSYLTTLRGAIAALSGATVLLVASSNAASDPAGLGELDTAPVDRYSYTVAGWAAQTVGGRGGRLLRVTNLAAGGAGSLRAAIDAEGPRVVVFEVGGVIDMAGRRLEIRNPYITIAGQTAPAPGITLIKGEVLVTTHDVIVQHLSFRPGEFGRPKRGGGDQDGLSTGTGAYRVIVDHCSFSWATDENLSASGERFEGATPDDWRRGTSHDITFSHNLNYEGLSNSVHSKGEHSKGTLIHDNATGILLYRNVYASNRERSALFKGGAYGAMVNNLIYNPGTRAVHYNLHASEWGNHPYQIGRLALLGNVYRAGPSTRSGTPLFTLLGDGDLELTAEDNIAVDRLGLPLEQVANLSRGRAKVMPTARPYVPPDIRRLPARILESTLLVAVGARPWERSELDARVIADIREGRGKIIDSEIENPLGYPKSTATRRIFDAAAWRLDDMSPATGWSSLMSSSGKP